MKKQAQLILVVVLLLIGLCAGLLLRLQAGQKLGKPGVKVVDQPIHNPKGKIAGTNRVDLPVEVAGAKSDLVPITDMELNWLPKDTTFGRRIYRGTDGFEALISVVLMGTDRTSIHKPEYCLLGQGWQIEKDERVTLPMTKPHPYELPIRKMTLHLNYKQKDGQIVPIKGLYVFWFVADNQLTAEHGDRMWRMAKDLLHKGVLERWAYVTYFAQCMPGQEDAAFNRLKDFIANSVPEFQITAGSPSTLQTSSLHQ